MLKSLSLLTALFLVTFFTACQEEPMTTQSANPQNDGSLLMGKGDVIEYEVTVENLTPATMAGASQPFSPPILATHQSSYDIFNLGQYASDELRKVAEDAMNADMVSMLQNSSSVYQVVTGDGVILPGESATYTIMGTKADAQKLSLVTMLVNTNDAFAGGDKLQLPFKGSKTYYLRSYDAGTEENTELTDHIPGPCCGSGGVRVPTMEKIMYHAGIQGTGDLDPSIYDWSEPVAKITITVK